MMTMERRIDTYLDQTRRWLPTQFRKRRLANLTPRQRRRAIKKSRRDGFEL